MKKILISKGVLILIFLSFSIIVNAQSRKQKKANEDTKNWRYEVECVGIGKQGTSLIKVWSYSKKPNIAINQAKKNAVHAIIFQGYAGGSQGCTSQKPLSNNPAIEQQKKEFFDSFFANGGKYMKFASASNDQLSGIGDKLKVGKEYKIGVVVTVMTANLRKDLEAAGIIKGLSSGF